MPKQFFRAQFPIMKRVHTERVVQRSVVGPPKAKAKNTKEKFRAYSNTSTTFQPPQQFPSSHPTSANTRWISSYSTLATPLSPKTRTDSPKIHPDSTFGRNRAVVTRREVRSGPRCPGRVPGGKPNRDSVQVERRVCLRFVGSRNSTGRETGGPNGEFGLGNLACQQSPSRRRQGARKKPSMTQRWFSHNASA